MGYPLPGRSCIPGTTVYVGGTKPPSGQEPGLIGELTLAYDPVI